MWVSKMSFTIIINKSDIFYLEEKNMLSWLKGMEKHDFTGKRAKISKKKISKNRLNENKLVTMTSLPV